ncbi:hypothetical protein EH165_00105 [Nakamurella antarctica]|uniref:Uncharacterized protein n=1 Tax=Nakamurella antarctica TaxID=1902245 RepID=A0A3G8ZHZ0_9ACTN|nr:DUF6226 family protein [Nakamurella antarctica]AZI56810.1 hypothetical protein EH165_00105 [Nakamurella antarctica]
MLTGGTWAAFSAPQSKARIHGAAIPWWEDFNEHVLEWRPDGIGEHRGLISPEICDLLRDVDAADEPQLPECANPRRWGAWPLEGQYSRGEDSARYLLVQARGRAWAKLFLDRGWANLVPVLLGVPPLPLGGRCLVLQFRASGAVALVFVIHTPETDERPVSVTIAAGKPAVALTRLPHCDCDACDDGSADLLREMDPLALSVVDGSIRVERGAHGYSMRTSFGGVGRAKSPLAGTFAGVPWPERWTARTLISQFPT